ncbi:MAG: hypothetical protein AAF705_21560, partial [Bacteroidota bacterium]
KAKAIKTYQEGLAIFPNAGNLYLEIGNVYGFEEDFDQAIKSYEEGIRVDPMYPSNYFRLADLFLRSTNKVPGLIYGELFMNIERTTDRTMQMSELLFSTYQNAININGDSMSIDFCEIILSIEDLSNTDEFKLPFCAHYGKNMSLAVAFAKEEEIDLQSLAEIRSQFIDLYFADEASKDYPVVLFDYQKKMKKAGIFDTYNRYLFQVSNQEEFNKWLEDHQADFDQFVDWYTAEENIIKINQENKYIRN